MYITDPNLPVIVFKVLNTPSVMTGLEYIGFSTMVYFEICLN